MKIKQYDFSKLTIGMEQAEKELQGAKGSAMETRKRGHRNRSLKVYENQMSS